MKKVLVVVVLTVLGCIGMVSSQTKTRTETPPSPEPELEAPAVAEDENTEAGAQEQPAPPGEVDASIERFVPSEKISEDRSVAFPNDI